MIAAMYALYAWGNFDEAPERNPVGPGEIVTTWEDEHGQWDLALIRL